jgi:hypothetical protein
MVVVREAANIIEYCQGEHFVSLPKDGSLEARELPSATAGRPSEEACAKGGECGGANDHRVVKAKIDLQEKEQANASARELISYSPSKVSTVDVKTHHKFLLLAAQMHLDATGLLNRAMAPRRCCVDLQLRDSTGQRGASRRLRKHQDRVQPLAHADGKQGARHPPADRDRHHLPARRLWPRRHEGGRWCEHLRWLP